jgi:hypothetical protein
VAVTEYPATGTISAAGTASLQFRPPRGGAEVQQVGIRAPNVGGGAVGNITKNGRIVTPFVATGDAPAGAPYVTLQTGDVIAAEWTSATVGAAVEAVFFYDDYS